MDLTGGGGAWNSQPYVKPFCLSSTLQPTAEFSQRGSCVLSHSLRNSGVRLAACGLPDVARVLLPCHRINVIAHRLRAVVGTHMSAARNQKTRAGRNLSDGSAASRSPSLLISSWHEITFGRPFLRRPHVHPSSWAVLCHFLCYSPGAIVSGLSVTPSHAIQDCRHQPQGCASCQASAASRRGCSLAPAAFFQLDSIALHFTNPGSFVTIY